MAGGLLFSAAAFLSSALLFALEPLAAKLALPWFGGSPSVWSVSLVFYQVVLLLGYAWADALAARLAPRRQAALQLALLAAAAAVLPLRLLVRPDAWAQAHPSLGLLAALGASVGAPFLALSACGPLLASWLSKALPRSEPYRLYAAGNLGSLLALLAYPFVIEPALGLAAQGCFWTVGYAVLFALVAVLIYTLPPQSGERERVGGNPILGLPRLRWLILAAIPSGLSLALTTLLVNEVAPMPLLWVAPLATYLLTLTLAFGPGADRWRRLGLAGLPWAGFAWSAAILSDFQRPLTLVLFLHLGLLFFAGLACHGLLYAERPSSEKLTGYFLWVAAGGAAGGLFAGLAAPALFRSLAEAPLLVLAAMILAATLEPEGGRYRFSHVASALGVGAASAAALLKLRDGGGPAVFAAGALAAFVIARWAPSRPVRFGAALGAALLLVAQARRPSSLLLFGRRTFYGVHRVTASEGGRGHFLAHGNTVHGVERADPPWVGEPLAYYSRSGPAGDLFATFDGKLRGGKVAVIGLGAGSLAAFARPGQHWTFYELDPTVQEIAQNPALFTFLKRCAAAWNVVLGDARLSLASAEPGAYSMIVIDAFGSDSVPTHLLTREALELYLSKLDERGVLAFHATNRYLVLEPVIEAVASELGLSAYSDNQLVEQSRFEAGILPSRWVALARHPETLAPLSGRQGWHLARPMAGVPAWTDDFTALVPVFRWR